MNIRLGNEPLSDFLQALQQEDIRRCNNWSQIWYYKQRGFYYKHLKKYFDIFDRSQIKVCLYEDLKINPIGLLQDIFQFLCIDNKILPNITTKYNVAQPMPQNKNLHTLLSGNNPLKAALKPCIPPKVRHRIINSLKKINLSKPSLTPEIRSQLIWEYRDDVLALQDLIHRDLSKWLI